jgi:hypothetical protein
MWIKAVSTKESKLLGTSIYVILIYEIRLFFIDLVAMYSTHHLKCNK